MTLIRYLFSGPDGTDLTTSNVVSDNGIHANTVAGPAVGFNTAKFSAADSGARFVSAASGGSGTGSLVRLLFNTASSPNAAESFWVTLMASPSTTGATFWTLRDTTSKVYSLIWDGQGTTGPSTGGRLILTDQAGTFYYPAADNLTKIAAGKYRFEVQAVNAATTGSVNLQVYDTTGALVLSKNFTGLVGRAANFVSSDIGIVGATPSWNVAIGIVQMDDGRTTAIGPYVPAIPPVAVPSETDNTALISLIGSSPQNGGTLAYTLTPTTGVTQVTPGVWKVAAQAGSVVYTYTVTETYGAGQTIATTGTVTVAAKTQAVGTKVRLSGVWT